MLKKLSFFKYEHKIPLTISIKLESHLNLPRLKQLQSNNFNPIKEAIDLGLSPKSFSLKKKNKILLTILSSPHVHKKSREQYKIDHYRTFVLLRTKNIEQYKKFLQFKMKLYKFHLNQGLQITLSYSKSGFIQGVLPF